MVVVAVTQSDEGSLGYVGEKRPGRGGRGTQEGGEGDPGGGGIQDVCKRGPVCVCVGEETQGV